MFEAAAVALQNIVQPVTFLYLISGVAVGILIGLLPGLGGMSGMAILLPFVFGLEPHVGIALLLGMASVTQTSDAFPAVLLGIPGTSASQATIMDGYPMARAGQAGKALGAAFTVSMIGGVIGALVLFAILPVARPIILQFRSPELFMLTLLGVSMVGVLSRGSPIAGLVSGFFGLLLAGVGGAPASPVMRYTFGQLYFMDGIPLVLIALGLFAVPELIDLLRENRAVSRSGQLEVGGGLRDGFRAGLRHPWLVARSSMGGAALGLIPGVGGSVIDWLMYGATVQTSKNRENFGRGDVRGVIGPEAASNAKEGGSLIPTMLFGIPGSGTTAMLLGGLLLMGVEPGPRMIEGPGLVLMLTIVWTLALANIFGTSAAFGLTNVMMRVSLVPPRRLAPIVFVIVSLAAFQASRAYTDFILLLVLGYLGWWMKQSRWPRSPMLIGFVLGSGSERYLGRSVARYGFEWLLFPRVIVIMVIMVLLVGGLALNRERRIVEKASS